jgi:hypothetical protein
MDDVRQEMSRQGRAMMMEQTKMASVDNLRQYPSAFDLQILISTQVLDYDRKDLMKIAMDVKNGVKGASKAFSFIRNAITAN